MFQFKKKYRSFLFSLQSFSVLSCAVPVPFTPFLSLFQNGVCLCVVVQIGCLPGPCSLWFSQLSSPFRACSIVRAAKAEGPTPVTFFSSEFPWGFSQATWTWQTSCSVVFQWNVTVIHSILNPIFSNTLVTIRTCLKLYYLRKWHVEFWMLWAQATSV